MKKSLILVLAALLFVILGCSLDRFRGTDDPAPTPVSDTSGGLKSDDKSADKPDSSGGSLTMENYEKLKLDMNYDEVVDILGSKGIETRTSKVGTIETKSYKWEGEKSVRIYASFRNDKMILKSNTGLRKSPSKDGSESGISMAKYEQIKDGMSVSEVEDILGTKGEVISRSSISGNSIETYRWKGEKFSYISVSFENDKVNRKTKYGLK